MRCIKHISQVIGYDRDIMEFRMKLQGGLRNILIRINTYILNTRQFYL